MASNSDERPSVVPMPAVPSDAPASSDPPDNSVLPDLEDYAQLIDDYSHLAPPAEGELLRGHVLSITDNEVIVDVGYKSEGVVPIAQFRQPDGSIQVKKGDEIDVMADRRGTSADGYVLLSHDRAVRARSWENLEKAYQEKLLVSGRVIGRTRGGLSVDVGVEAFLPASHLDIRPIHNLERFIGQDLPVMIVKLNRRRGYVVV